MTGHEHPSVPNLVSQKRVESVYDGPGPTRTVASELAAWLRSLGVEQAFGVDSHYLTPLWPALWETGIRIRMAATETGAGYMADGYARATGRLGVATTGGGPGLAMMIPALQTAMVERVPLLVVVGQSATTGIPLFQMTGAQGSRDLQMLRGLLESSDAVTRVVSVAEASAVPEAFEVALEALHSGGPAVIAIPVDVQSEPADLPLGAPAQPYRRPFVWTRRPEGAGGTAPRDTAPPAATLATTDPANTPQQPVPYWDVLAAVAESLPDARIFVDAGQARHAAHEVLPKAGVTFFDCPRSAPMGWAIAAAVGAGLARSGRGPQTPDVGVPAIASPPAHIEDAAPVVCVTGDGSALMVGNEFATAVRYRVAVTFVICVNHVWGGPFQRHRGMPYGDLADLPTIEWLGFAASMGLPASRVATAAELGEALRARRQETGPQLVLVHTPAKDDTIRAPYTPGAPLTGR